jgi:CubicO group peptidase (beta-lactamase class C family)
MDSVQGAPGEKYFFAVSHKPSIDFTKAREAYANAVENSQGRHAEVGILSPEGTITFERLGKNEEYGAHRIGSVTKTFTTFLAMKLANMKVANKDVLPHGLETKCGEVIDKDLLAQVFEEPDTAARMTLRQLLSHTSGLDIDDHCALPHQKLEPVKTLQERFLQETTRKGGRKYAHIVKPGDGIGFYSNGGLAVAGWMMESAYNKSKSTHLSFAEIMEQEVFKGLFGCEESFIRPGPTGDSI